MNNIAFIGAGKISYSLVHALCINNYEVSFILSRTQLHAKQLASKYSISNYSVDPKDIPSGINIFFLAVPDSSIKKIADGLSKLNLKFTKTLFIHLSGSKNISVLNGLKKQGASVGSLHIMQTFPSRRAINIKGAHAAIEAGDNKSNKFLFELANNLGLNAFKIASDKKTLYHLSGVFASNILLANLNNSERVLKAAKLNIPAPQLLSGIVNTTLRNAEKNGIPGALSGPIERGDYDTIKDHIGAIKKMKNNKDILRSYIIQSLSLIEIAYKKHGSLTEGHHKIKTLLQEYVKY